jgi:hypothetical protein
MIARAAAIALFLGALVLAHPAADQTPTRDGGVSSPAAGTGAIAGVLMNSDSTPAPIRRALLTLSGSALTMSPLTSTDDAGRFVFTGLPAGRFLLSASKTGYVRDSYGSRQPGGAGSPLALTAGQRVNVTMKMTRAAVITGTVLLPTGAPTSSARLQLLKYGVVDGERRLVSAVGGAYGTNDEGMYRLSGLAPGEYFVTVSAWNSGADEMRLTDLSITPPAMPARVGFSPVFYPGVVDPARAVAITVAAGEERAGIDIPMQFVPTSRIDGVILDPIGEPAQRAEVSLVDAMPVPRSSIMVRPGPDGRFSLTGLWPGRYVLRARAAAPGAAPAPVPAGGRAGAPPPLSLWANQEIEVDGHDLSDVVVRLQPGRTVSGRIVFEPGSTPAPTGFGLFVVALEGPQARPGQSDAAAFANEDGTFALSGVPPGRYSFRVQLPSSSQGLANWTLKSAIVDGRDVLDEPLTLTPNRDLAGMTVTYTDRAASLSGVLTDAAGQPAPEFFVVAFSTEKRFWTDGSRRVAQARPARDGSFTFTGLPPGEYYVCALTNVQTGQLGDPSFLEPLIGASFKITLAEGEKKRQDLRIGGLID